MASRFREDPDGVSKASKVRFKNPRAQNLARNVIGQTVSDIQREQQTMARAQEDAAKAQAKAQADMAKQQAAAEEANRAMQVRAGAAQGMKTETDIVTGKRSIATHPDGAPVFKAKPLGDPVEVGTQSTAINLPGEDQPTTRPFVNPLMGDDGGAMGATGGTTQAAFAQPVRDDRGNVRMVEPDTTTDAKTGRQYTSKTDPMTGATVKTAVGIDQSRYDEIQRKAQLDAKAREIALRDNAVSQHRTRFDPQFKPVADEWKAAQKEKESLPPLYVKEKGVWRYTDPKTLKEVTTFDPGEVERNKALRTRAEERHARAEEAYNRMSPTAQNLERNEKEIKQAKQKLETEKLRIESGLPDDDGGVAEILARVHSGEEVMQSEMDGALMTALGIDPSAWKFEGESGQAIQRQYPERPTEWEAAPDPGTITDERPLIPSDDPGKAALIADQFQGLVNPKEFTMGESGQGYAFIRRNGQHVGRLVTEAGGKPLPSPVFVLNDNLNQNADLRQIIAFGGTKGVDIYLGSRARPDPVKEAEWTAGVFGSLRTAMQAGAPDAVIHGLLKEAGADQMSIFRKVRHGELSVQRGEAIMRDLYGTTLKADDPLAPGAMENFMTEQADPDLRKRYALAKDKRDTAEMNAVSKEYINDWFLSERLKPGVTLASKLIAEKALMKELRGGEKVGDFAAAGGEMAASSFGMMAAIQGWHLAEYGKDAFFDGNDAAWEKLSLKSELVGRGWKNTNRAWAYNAKRWGTGNGKALHSAYVDAGREIASQIAVQDNYADGVEDPRFQSAFGESVEKTLDAAMKLHEMGLEKGWEITREDLEKLNWMPAMAALSGDMDLLDQWRELLMEDHGTRQAMAMTEELTKGQNRYMAAFTAGTVAPPQEILVEAASWAVTFGVGKAIYGTAKTAKIAAKAKQAGQAATRLQKMRAAAHGMKDDYLKFGMRPDTLANPATIFGKASNQIVKGTKFAAAGAVTNAPQEGVMAMAERNATAQSVTHDFLAGGLFGAVMPIMSAPAVAISNIKQTNARKAAATKYAEHYNKTNKDTEGFVPLTPENAEVAMALVPDELRTKLIDEYAGAYENLLKAAELADKYPINSSAQNNFARASAAFMVARDNHATAAARHTAAVQAIEATDPAERDFASAVAKVASGRPELLTAAERKAATNAQTADGKPYFADVNGKEVVTADGLLDADARFPEVAALIQTTESQALLEAQAAQQITPPEDASGAQGDPATGGVLPPHVSDASGQGVQPSTAAPAPAGAPNLAEMDAAEYAMARAENPSMPEIAQTVADAVAAGRPVSVSMAKAAGIETPAGYTRQGAMLVPSNSTPNSTPTPIALGQSVNVSMDDGSTGTGTVIGMSIDGSAQVDMGGGQIIERSAAQITPAAPIGDKGQTPAQPNIGGKTNEKVLTPEQSVAEQVKAAVEEQMPALKGRISIINGMGGSGGAQVVIDTGVIELSLPDIKRAIKRAFGDTSAVVEYLTNLVARHEAVHLVQTAQVKAEWEAAQAKGYEGSFMDFYEQFYSDLAKELLTPKAIDAARKIYGKDKATGEWNFDRIPTKWQQAAEFTRMLVEAKLDGNTAQFSELYRTVTTQGVKSKLAKIIRAAIKALTGMKLTPAVEQHITALKELYAELSAPVNTGQNTGQAQGQKPAESQQQQGKESDTKEDTTTPETDDAILTAPMRATGDAISAALTRFPKLAGKMKEEFRAIEDEIVEALEALPPAERIAYAEKAIANKINEIADREAQRTGKKREEVIESFRAVAGKQAAKKAASIESAVIGTEAPAIPAGRQEQRDTPNSEMTVDVTSTFVDLDQLVGSSNPLFPGGALQPRNRSTQASQNQREEMVQNIRDKEDQYRRYVEGSTTDAGRMVVSPLFGSDGKQMTTTIVDEKGIEKELPLFYVVSGNGRLNALNEAVKRGVSGKIMQGFRTVAATEKTDVTGMRLPGPVSIFVPTSAKEAIDLAEYSNRDAQLSVSNTEQANRDAASIEKANLLPLWSPDGTGDAAAASNRDFVKAFARAVADEGIIDSRGNLTEEGAKRIERAMVAMLLGPDQAVVLDMLFNNSGTLGLRAMLGGVASESGSLLKLAAEKPDFDLSPVLATALRAAVEAKQSLAAGEIRDVGEYFDQGNLFESSEMTPERQLARAIVESRSRKAVGEILGAYRKAAQAVDTSTMSMFAEAETSRADLILAALEARPIEQVVAEVEAEFGKAADLPAKLRAVIPGIKKLPLPQRKAMNAAIGAEVERLRDGVVSATEYQRLNPDALSPMEAMFQRVLDSNTPQSLPAAMGKMLSKNGQAVLASSPAPQPSLKDTLASNPIEGDTADSPVEVVVMIKPLGMTDEGRATIMKWIGQNKGQVMQSWRGNADAQRISSHYGGAANQPYYPSLIRYFQGQEVIAMRVKLPNRDLIGQMRDQIGPSTIWPETLRGTLVGNGEWVKGMIQHGAQDNGIHLSDSVEAGKREVNIWFGVPELLEAKPESKVQHARIWTALSEVTANVRMSGSNYNGTAAPSNLDDLDYTVLAENDAIDDMVNRVREALPDAVVDTINAVDPTSGEYYHKLEINFPTGKADIAIVPISSYNRFLHHGPVAAFMPDAWKKAVVVEKETHAATKAEADKLGKDHPKRVKAKNDYNSYKKEMYRQVRRFFNLDRFSEHPVIGTVAFDKAVDRDFIAKKRDAAIARESAETGAILDAAIGMVDPKVLGHLVDWAKNHKWMPKVSGSATVAKTESTVVREVVGITRKHGGIVLPDPFNTEGRDATVVIVPTLKDAFAITGEIQIALEKADNAITDMGKTGMMPAAPILGIADPSPGWRHENVIKTKDGRVIFISTPEIHILRHLSDARSREAYYSANLNQVEALVGLRDFFYEAYESNRSATRASTSSLEAALQSVIGVLRGTHLPPINSRAPMPGRPSGQDPKSQTTGLPSSPTAKEAEGDKPAGNKDFSITSKNTDKGASSQDNSASVLASSPAPELDLFGGIEAQLTGPRAKAKANAVAQMRKAPPKGKVQIAKSIAQREGIADLDLFAAAAVRSLDTKPRKGEAALDDSATGQPGNQGNPRLHGGQPAKGARGSGGIGTDQDLFGWSGGTGRQAGNEAGGSTPSVVQGEEAGIPGSGDGSAATDADSGRGRPGTGRPAGGRKGGGQDTGDAGKRKLTERPRPLIGSPDRNFTIGKNTVLAEGGAVTRLRNNLAAIDLLRNLEKEGRNATEAEKAALAKYVGWGGIPQVFDETKARAIDNGEIETRRETARSYEGYGAQYAAEVGRQKDRADELEKWRDKWGDHYAKLKELLSPAEWESARDSTINAHYTSPTVISAMWDAVKRMGFDGGNVLEPAGGVGHFFGLMPPSLVGRSRQFGVELDSVSGRLFAKLYPEAEIEVTGFQDSTLPDNSQDLVISNVPFANINISDPYLDAQEGAPKFNLHNYFFERALRMTRPGGLVAFITTANTMDSQITQRKWLAERADFLGAIRLPNDAFKGNANTQVVTDIIFLRKPDGTNNPMAAENWKSTQKAKIANGSTVEINEYFARHPEMILGELADDGSMYGGKKEMTVHSTGDLAEQLRAAIALLPENVVGDGQAAEIDRLSVENREAKDGAFIEEEGNLRIKGSAEPIPPKEVGRVRSFMKLRDTLNDLYAMEADPDSTDAQINAQRAALNRAYDAHKAVFKLLHDPKNKKLLMTDPDFYRTLGLEVPVGERTILRNQKFAKADVFSRRVLKPQVEPDTAANIDDALLHSFRWKGRLDTRYVGKLLGIPLEQAESRLLATEYAFRDPATGKIEHSTNYLAGNVRKKLRDAEFAAQRDSSMQRNVDALRAAMPEDVGWADISFKMGSSWIPAEMYERFLAEKLFGGRKLADITYNKGVGDIITDSFMVKQSPSGYAHSVDTQWGTPRMNATQIAESLLNQRDPRITKTVEGKPVYDAAASDMARAAASRMADAFQEWVAGNVEVQESLHRIYNEGFNSHVIPKYDGSFMQLPWVASEFDLYPDKKHVVWRALQEGSLLVAHGVGGGKTIIGTAIAMEARRLGLAKKPLIVVHNATLEQFATTISQMAPTARVLVARKEDLAGPKRKEFMGRVRSGDWDAVVMAHSTFDLIPDDPAWEKQQIDDLIAELEDAIREAGGDPGVDNLQKIKDASVKELVKMRNRLRQRLEKMQERRTDDVLTFQELGIDAMIVDEVHRYKKQPFVTRQSNIAGIDTSFSKRGSAMQLRSKWVQAINQGRGVYTMTGTPVTNTLGESWNMVRLVRPDLLKEFGVQTFDRFVSVFGNIKQSGELRPNGQYKPVTRLSEFTNIPEWNRFWGLAADVKMGDDMQVKGRPRIKGGKPALNAVERTPQVKSIIDEISKVIDAYDQMTGKEKHENQHIPLLTYAAARMAAIDVRLINPEAMDDAGSKVNTALKNVMRLYGETTEHKGTQVIFSDSYRPLKTTKLDLSAAEFEQALGDPDADPSADTDDAPGFNLYHDMRDKLVKAGVPRSEIAIIGEMKNDKQREALFARVNSGEVRIIMGSTETLGTGVNMQQRMIAAHHLDVPWTPAGLEQRDGRVYRQGNLWAELGREIEIMRYGMKDTLDAALWQKLETKERMIKQAVSGKVNARVIEDDAGLLNYMEQKAALSGADGMLKFELDEKVRQLKNDFRAHRNRQFDLQRATTRANEEIGKAGKNLPAARKLAETVAPLVGVDPAEVEWTFQDGKPLKGEEARKALDEIFKERRKRAGAIMNPETAESIREPIPATANGVSLLIEPGSVQEDLANAANPDLRWSLSWSVKFMGEPSGKMTDSMSPHPGSVINRTPTRAESLSLIPGSMERNRDQAEKDLSTFAEESAKPFAKQDAYGKALVDQAVLYRRMGISFPESADIYQTGLGEKWESILDAAVKESQEEGKGSSAARSETPANYPGAGLAPRNATLMSSPAPVTPKAVRSYLDSNGTRPDDALRESERVSTALAQDRPGNLAEGGSSYSQGDLFAPGQPAPPSQGKQIAAAGSRALARAKAKTGRDSLSDDLIRGMAGDWAALAREVDAKGSASSILADLINREIPVWNVNGTILDSPEAVHAVMLPIRSPYFESLKVMVLDGNLKTVLSQILTVGSVDETSVHPAEMFGTLARLREIHGKKYSTLVFSHNHPGGDPSPSRADERTTRRINEVAEMAGWNVMDHVITNGETYYSFREAGIIGGNNLKETPYTPRKDKGTPAPDISKEDRQAPWEAVKRSELKPMDTPERIADMAKHLRNANPDAAHILYTNTRLNLLAVERVDLVEVLDQEKLARRLIAARGREGAYGFIIDYPQGKSTGAIVAQRVQKVADLLNIRFVDAVTMKSEGRGYESARENGFLSEAPARATQTQADLFTASRAPDAGKKLGDVKVGKMHALTAYRSLTGKREKGIKLTAKEEQQLLDAEVALGQKMAFDMEALKQRPGFDAQGRKTPSRPQVATDTDSLFGKDNSFKIDKEGQMRLFSSPSPEMDAAYLSAVENGRIGIAQQMVDSVIKSLNYTTGPVWHGSPTKKRFSIFAPEKLGTNTDAGSAKQAFFFADRELEATEYSLIKKFGDTEFDPDPNSKLDDLFRKVEELNDTADTLQEDQPSLAEQIREEAAETQEKLLEYADEIRWAKIEAHKAKARGQVYRLFLKGEFKRIEYNSNFRAETFSDNIKKAFAEGFNGVHFVNVKDTNQSIEQDAIRFHDVFAVKSPEQIAFSDPVARDSSGNIIPLSQRFNPQSILYSSPSPTPDDSAAVEAALDSMKPRYRRVFEAINEGMTPAQVMAKYSLTEKAVANILDAVRSRIATALSAAADPSLAPAMREGKFDGGRPDLALSTIPEVAAVDQIRNESDIPGTESWEDVVAAAETRLRADYAGEYDRMLDLAKNQKQMETEEVAITKLIIARETMEGRAATKEQRVKLAMLIHGYRDVGTETARALAIRRDPHKSPAERHAQFIAEALFTPDEATRKTMRNASPGQQADILASWMARVDAIKAELKNRGLDLDASLAAFNEKNEARKQAEADSPRVKAAMDEAIRKLTKREKAVVEAIRGGALASQAMQLTGFSKEEIKDIWTQFVADYRANMKAAALRFMATTLGSSPAGNYLQQLEAEMGIFDWDVIDDTAKDFVDVREEIRNPKPAKPRKPSKPKTGTAKPEKAEAEEMLGIGDKPLTDKQKAAIERFVNAEPSTWVAIRQETAALFPESTGFPESYESGEDARRILSGVLFPEDVNETTGTFDLNDPAAMREVINAFALARGTKMDALMEFWRMSILTGPQTHIVNMGSNFMFAAYNAIPRRAVEAATNSALSAIGLGSKEAATFGEFSAMAKNLRKGIQLGARQALTSWNLETRTFEKYAEGETLQLEFTGVGAETFAPKLGGKIGKIMRSLSFRAMTAADEFMKHAYGQMEAAAQAHRIAKVEEKLTGAAYEARIEELMKPGSKAWIRAIDVAREITFQDKLDGTGMRSLNRIDQLAELAKTGRAMPWLGRPFTFFLPFIDTPTNIAKRGIEMSPLGGAIAVIDGLRALRRKVARGKMSKAEADAEASQIYDRARLVRDVTNQTIAWAMYFAITGLVKPDDDDEDGRPFITGTQPYKTTKRGERDNAYAVMPPQSIRIGDVVFSYARIEPFAVMMAGVVDLIQEIDRNNGTLNGAAASSYLMRLKDQAKDKTFLQGVSDLLDAIEDPDRFAERAGANILTGFVPNIIRQPIREMNPYIRDSHPRTEEGFFTAIARRIGYSIVPQLAPVKQDLWGNDIKANRGKDLLGLPAADALKRALDPLNSSIGADPAPIDAWIFRYNQVTGDSSERIGLTPLQSHVTATVDGKRVKLPISVKEQREANRNAGQAARALLGEDWDWRTATEDGAKDMADRIVDTVRQSQRNERERLRQKKLAEMRAME